MLTVEKTNPQDGQRGLPLLSPVIVDFNVEIDPDSINSGTFLVTTEATKLITQGPNYLSGYLPADDDLMGELFETPSFTQVIKGEFNISDNFLQATFEPSSPMKENVVHTILLSKNILTRTIGPVQESGYAGEKQGDGVIALHGPYTGVIEDTLYIKIVTSGKCGTAKFISYRGSDPTLATEDITTEPMIQLEDGIIVYFSGGEYIAEDLYTAWLKPGEPLDKIYGWSFVTATDAIVIPPDVQKSSSLLGTSLITGDSPEVSTTILKLLSSNPVDGASDQDLDIIELTFDDTVDKSSVTKNNIIVYYRGIKSSGHRSPGRITPTYTVSANADTIIITLDEEIPTNQNVHVKIQNITSGSKTFTTQILSFATIFTPFYSTAEQIRYTPSSSYLVKVSDDTINRVIHNSSLFADYHNYTSADPVNDEKYWFIMNQFVVCDVTFKLLQIKSEQIGRSHQKSLGDLQVSVGKGQLDPSDLLGSAEECREYWLEFIKSGGAAIKPRIVVKGEDDPNRPAFGRTWIVEGGEYPLGNVREAYLRRVYRTGKKIHSDLDDQV